jgi:itaconyl-CoA hydratase
MAGKYFEELETGMHFKHSAGRTITETDNLLFTALTMNTQPLTVSELSEGTIIANLSYDKITHPHPTFHNDTIYAETEVLEKRESRSRPNAGIVKFRHWGKKSDGTVKIEFERTAMFLKKPKG